EVLPGAGDFLHLGLAAELALGADLARDARNFSGERAELVDHAVDGVLQVEDLAADIDADLAREITGGDGLGDVAAVSALSGPLSLHDALPICEVLPGAGDFLHLGLAAELALGADLARHARDFGGEGTELVDHAIDGVLQVEDLAADIDADLAREIAGGDGLRDVGDVPDLSGQVAGHRVDGVGEVLPGPGDILAVPLPPELPFGADLARHARDFGGERAELVSSAERGVREVDDLA